MEQKDEIAVMLGDVIDAGGSGDVDDNIGNVSDNPIIPDVLAVNDTDAKALDELRKQFADTVAEPNNNAVIDNPLDKFKDDIEFMTKADLDALADNPALLNIAMNQVRRQTAESLLTSFPYLINQAIIAHQQKQEIHNTFYTAHKELIPYKGFVSTIAKEVVEKMKDKPHEEILTEIAKSAKERLKMPTISVAIKPSNNGGKPALRDVRGSARSVGTDAVDKLTVQSQIADMLGV